MVRTTHTYRKWQLWLMGAMAAFAACTAQAQSTNQSKPVQTIAEAFEITWSRQPEARSQIERQQALRAQQAAAQAWTPEPPSLELSSKSDSWRKQAGATEQTLGISMPLWLPGERRQGMVLIGAQMSAFELQTKAQQLQVAGLVRESWWALQRAHIDKELANDQLQSLLRIASDVQQRVRAGDLAQSDARQAEGAVASAESNLAQAEATLTAARQSLNTLVGAQTEFKPATPLIAESEPKGAQLDNHAALLSLQAKSDVAQQATQLALLKKRSNPELTLAKSRDRNTSAEPYGEKYTIGLRIPFGSGSRHDASVALAQAELTELQTQLALDKEQLNAQWHIAQAKVNAARLQLKATERWANLAQANRSSFEKSFRLGETDLPTRLRAEAEAAEAMRQASRIQIELAAAISQWRQAAGLLP